MLRPERLNLFVYTTGDPVNHKDPSGLDMGIPVDPFNRGRGWCIECDWLKLAQCLAQVYDQEQFEACKAVCEAVKTLPPLHKWIAATACAACLVGKGYEFISCFSENCKYKECCNQ